MQETHTLELGDLVIFVDTRQSEGYGTVIRLEADFVEVVWPGVWLNAHTAPS